MESTPLQTGLIIVTDKYPVKKSSRTCGYLLLTHLPLKTPGTFENLKGETRKETDSWHKI